MNCRRTECHDIIKTTHSCHVKMKSARKILRYRGFVAEMQSAALDKNRPFGAEKSSEPSLILADERLNDTSCLKLRTWCQTDTNLLAGDVPLFCPPVVLPIHLHFYCRCTDFLADSTDVCVCD